eukprot:jgi/Psemu1/10636/gm1.10636_g
MTLSGEVAIVEVIMKGASIMDGNGFSGFNEDAPWDEQEACVKIEIKWHSAEKARALLRDLKKIDVDTAVRVPGVAGVNIIDNRQVCHHLECFGSVHISDKVSDPVCLKSDKDCKGVIYKPNNKRGAKRSENGRTDVSYSCETDIDSEKQSEVLLTGDKLLSEVLLSSEEDQASGSEAEDTLPDGIEEGTKRIWFVYKTLYRNYCDVKSDAESGVECATKFAIEE